MYLVLHTFGNTNYFYKLPLQRELTKITAYNSLVPLSRERNKELWEGREVCGGSSDGAGVLGSMRVEL